MAAMFRQILEYFRSHKDVWFAHHHEVAKWIVEQKIEDTSYADADSAPMRTFDYAARVLPLMLACLIALASEALGAGGLSVAAGAHRSSIPRPVAAPTSWRACWRSSFRAADRASLSRIAAAAAASSASRRCSNAPADGYTLLMTPSTVTVLPAVTKQARYDAAKDFVAITQVAGISNVLVVHPDRAGEDAARADRAGEGQARHAQLRLGRRRLVAAHEHGIAQAHGRHRPAAHSVQGHRPGHDRGAVRPDRGAVLQPAHRQAADRGRQAARAGDFGAEARVAAMPDVPTVAEAGVPGYSALQWYGLLAPAGTPSRDRRRSLRRPSPQALRAPEVRERLAQDGAEPVGSGPAEFSALVKSELEKWADIARAANIQAEE